MIRFGAKNWFNSTGMDIAMYRARIGSFHASLKSRTVPWRPKVLILGPQCSLLVAFAILLLLGMDIETQPGPGTTMNDFVFRVPRSASTNDLATTTMSMDMQTDSTHSVDKNCSVVDANSVLPMSLDAKLDLVLTEVRATNSRLDSMDLKITTLETNVTKFKKKVETRVSELDSNQQYLYKQNNELKATVDQLRSKVNDLETDRRANNVVIAGVTINSNKTVVESVQSFLTDKLRIQHSQLPEINHAYKLRDQRVVVKFQSSSDRKSVLDFARTNRSTEWKIKPDICQDWQEARKKFAPMYAKALEDGREVQVRKDFMIIAGKRYVYDSKNDRVIEASQMGK